LEVEGILLSVPQGSGGRHTRDLEEGTNIFEITPGARCGFSAQEEEREGGILHLAV